MSNEKNLADLALKWLNESSPFAVKKNCLLEGKSGEDYKIDFMLESKNDKHETGPSKLAIKIVDQNRSLGTNVINKFENISKDLNVKTLIISNKFSIQAKHLAQRTDIMIMERDELESMANHKFE
jgi:hypothetical protein